MKLAVVGSRGFDNYNLLNTYLTKIHLREPITCIVSGGAKGADKLSERWAKENNIPTKIFYPDWDKFGKRAGFLRNNDIITEADKILACWDGISNGTKNSIELSKRQNKKCHVVYYNEKKE